MYFFILWIFILELQTSVSIHPAHMDFQKVGEVIFNNEKFNVLRPTTHVVSDYFKEFMLRQSDDNFPTKRVFIDDNGLRHAWSGFGEKIQSLRKTDLNNLTGSLENATQKTEAKSTSSNEKWDASVEDATVSKNYESNNDPNENNQRSDESKQQENATPDNNNSDKNGEVFTETPRSNETITIATLFRAAYQNDTNAQIVLERKLRQGKNEIKAKTPSPSKKESTNAAESKNGNNTRNANNTKTETTTKADKLRTVAQTTFFCPFFGVITMSAFID